MTLVEDYLRIVALLLPKAQRDDIVAELRDTVLTRIEARETDLDRALTETETEALLREIGHPLVVAARYRGGAQQAVGPTLYPYWAFGVKVAVTIQLALSALVFLVHAFSGGDVASAFGHAVYSAFDGIITVVGFATLAVWFVEWRQVRVDYLDRWRVRDLRVLEFAAWDLEALSDWVARQTRPRPATPHQGSLSYRASRGRGRASRALGGLAGCCVILLWWVGALHFGFTGIEDLRGMGIDPGPLAHVDLVQLKARLFWPILAYLALLISRFVLVLVGALTMVGEGLLHIASAAALLALVTWIWQASAFGRYVRLDGLAAAVDLMDKQHSSDVLRRAGRARRRPPGRLADRARARWRARVVTEAARHPGLLKMEPN
jgi:hypothetical protein